MAETIWKYKIEPTDFIELPIPTTAEILSVQMQNGDPCLWVKLDPSHVITKPRKFRLYGTGHEIKEGEKHKFIGTFQIMEGRLVFHLFEIVQ